MKGVYAIVPAAGEGRRFGTSCRKTFFSIKGIPLIIHTLKRIESEPRVVSIVPVVQAGDIPLLNHLLNTHNLNKAREAIAGGAERQDSVYNGLKAILNIVSDPGALIMIHDGARPLLPEGLIDNMVNALMEEQEIDGIIPGIRLTDTIKETDSRGFVLKTLDRDSLIAVQTPQIFRLGILEQAYKMAYEQGIYATDDSCLVEQAGGRIKVIEGSVRNIKITRRQDISLLMLYLAGEVYDQDRDWF